MDAEQRCKIFSQIKGNRLNWDTYAQTVHDYFDIVGQNINTTYSPGTELDFEYLYDSISLTTANILPAGLANYMTPFSGNWMFMKHKNPKINESKAVSTFYKEVQEEMFYVLGNSNFYEQIIPFYKGTSVYGTASILCEDDPKDVVRFINLPFKQCYIVEDSKGRVNEYYIAFQFSAQQAVDRFGYDKCSQEIKDAYDKGNYNNKKYDFFLYLGDRHDRNPIKEDAASMPIQAVWYDKTTQKEVMVSGYEQLPAMTHRFYKRQNEAYGFSPAMVALMDVRYGNTMSRTQIISAMKHSMPAWAVPDDTFLSPMNFNPDAINVYDSQNMNKDKIFTLGVAGDPQINEMMLQKKYDAIRENMFYDVFVAFKNITKQMTVPEVMQRANEQMTFLGPSIGMLQSDVLTNAWEIVLNKTWKAGRLPEMPDELRDDPNYEVEFTGRLVLAQRSNDLNALQTAAGMINEVAQGQMAAGQEPDILDNIDTDSYARNVFEITGANPDVRRGKKEIKQRREGRALQRQQASQQEQQTNDMQNVKTASEADKNMREANAG